MKKLLGCLLMLMVFACAVAVPGMAAPHGGPGWHHDGGHNSHGPHPGYERDGQHDGREKHGKRIFYRVHVAGIGWQDYVGNGEQAGTTGQGKAVEAIVIEQEGIRYRVYTDRYGWTEWKSSGEMAGTTGESLPIRAIQIRSKKADLSYQLHLADIGWISGRHSGEIAGDYDHNIECIRIFSR